MRDAAADFLALPETNQIRELIEGKLVVNPPNDAHQRVVVKMLLYLASIVALFGD